MLDLLPSPAEVTRLRIGEIRNAARHHRRALAALRSVPFDDLPETTVQMLLIA